MQERWAAWAVGAGGCGTAGRRFGQRLLEREVDEKKERLYNFSFNWGKPDLPT